jgi:hypothetical protein
VQMPPCRGKRTDEKRSQMNVRRIIYFCILAGITIGFAYFFAERGPRG